MQRSRGTSRSSASPNEASGASNTTEGRAGEWNEVIKSLAQCATDVVPIDIITDCGKVCQCHSFLFHSQITHIS